MKSVCALIYLVLFGTIQLSLADNDTTTITVATAHKNEGDVLEIYTIQEKSALKKFRHAMKDALKLDYMKTDEYLINWLRARNMDQERAREMLTKALDWRKAHSIDDVLKERFPILEKNYPYFSDIVDRKGRPVILLPIGAWDIRKIVVSGHSDEFVRFLEYLFELSFAEVRVNFGQDKRRNISQFTVGADIGGYNLRQHACVGCIPIYIRMIQNYENFYPQGVHKLIGFNTPPIFDALLQIIRPFMSEHSRKALHLYGFNKEQWKKVLLEEIAPDQLPVQFGGSKHAEYFVDNHTRT